MPPSLNQFASQLSTSGLLSAEEVAELRARCHPADAEALARELVKQKKLTAFQAQQCYAGKGKSLVLGNYILLDKLGQGGMGMVLKAQHRRMKRIVALKVLTPQVAKSPDLVARFQREVEAAARLTHPHIVAAFDADEAGGTVFLVMEYVPGQDLSSLVKKSGPLPVEQAVQCILQTARGLEYAHRHGVIHRDIKPANLLLDQDGTIKILDMGLARIEGESSGQAELTSTGAVMGTVDYMAPEQALSTKHADARSDVYSLGVSLWYLLAGRPVFEGDSLMARLIAHREFPAPSLTAARSGVPPALDALFQRMVAKAPADRPQSMAEVVAELEGIQRGDAVTGLVPQPQASDDSRFSEFLSHLGQTDPGRTSTLTPTAVTKPLVAVPQSEATLTSSDGELPTDPQTLTRLPATAPSRPGMAARTRSGSAGWKDWRLLSAGGGLVAVVLLVLLLRPRSEPPPPDVVSPLPAVASAVQPADDSAAVAPTTVRRSPVPSRFALHFDEQAAGLFLSPNLQYDGSFPLTIEAWAKPETLSGAQARHRGHLCMHHLLRVDYDYARSSWQLMTQTEQQPFMSTPLARDPQPGEWVHVAGVLNGREMSLFLNGQRQFTYPLGSPLSLRPDSANKIFYIGDGPEAGGQRFYGQIDEVRISKIARYTEDFVPQRRLLPDRDTLVLHPFEEGTGDAIADISLGRHDTRLANRPWGGKPKWVSLDGPQPADPALAPDTAGTPPAVDLLALVDPQRDTLLFNDARNQWERGGGWTRLPAGWQSGLGRRQLLRLAHAPTAPAYTLTVDFEISNGSGGMWIVLPIGGTECFFAYNGFKRDGVASAGFGYVDDKPENQNVTTASHPTLPPGRSQQLQFEVDLTGTAARIVAKVDGQELTRFEGETARLSIPGAVGGFADGAFVTFAVGSTNAQTLYQRVELTEYPAGRPSLANAPDQRATESTPGKTSPESIEPGWTELFNGRDLTGWKTHPQSPGDWRVEDGVLIGSGSNPSQLFSLRDDFTDFHLRVETRINSGGSAGVTCRAPFGFGNRDLPGAALGYLAKINANSGDRRKTGSLYVIEETRFQDGMTVEVSPIPSGEWFVMDVVVEGNRVLIRVNGETTTDYVDERRRFARGHFALQARGQARVEFRKIEVKPLNVPVVAAPPPAKAPFGAQAARAHQEAWARHLGVPVEWSNSLGISFVLIPPGEFLMGSTEPEIAPHRDVRKGLKTWLENLESELPRHAVVLTQPYYLGVYETRQREFAEIMGGDPSAIPLSGESSPPNPSLDMGDLPAHQLTWSDAAEFCERLSEREGLSPYYVRDGDAPRVTDGTGYRLPTEAEWEFACRAGTTTPYWSGDSEADLKRAGWYAGNSGNRMQTVGGLAPNPFGLFDVHGNVQEWCHDGYLFGTYARRASIPAVDPVVPPDPQNPLHKLRGGAWAFEPAACRSAIRNHMHAIPVGKSTTVGFRVLLPVTPDNAALW